MALSSTSIIHLTGDLETLYTILKEGFKPKYCYEHVRSKRADKYIHGAFPMVSFSDIPLSELKNQLDSYGDYGIGLTKSWAKDKGLNPVVYLENDSHLLERIVTVFLDFLKEDREGHKTIRNEKFVNLFMSVMSYSKNYEGRLKKKTKEVIEDYRFSDEREWRYVPPAQILKTSKAKLFVPEDKYKAEKDKYNQTLDSIRVKFKAKDIKYIIIKSESEVNDLINFIKNYVKKDYPQLQNKLISRILTSDQIRVDI